MNKKLFFIMIISSLLLLLYIFSDDVMKLVSPMPKSIPVVKEVPTAETMPLRELERVNKKYRLKFSTDEYQAGMNVLIYGHPNMSETRNLLEHLRSLGINSVALNFPFYQSDWQANEVFTSPEDTPTHGELRQVIDIAHEIGLSVMLRPIMDEKAFMPARWRGEIQPTNPDSWFDSYQTLMLDYAALAESANVKAFNIGTELNSLQSRHQERWEELIHEIRRIYNGEILYSLNYDTVSDIPSIEFLTSLDYIGVDAYFPLNLPDGATVNMLQEEWKKQITGLEDILTEQTIILTEAGVIPVTGAYRTPYVWDIPDGTFDPQVQVNYYEATFKVWKPLSDGIYWWAVTLGEDSDKFRFSPLSLPTENVIKNIFLK